MAYAADAIPRWALPSGPIILAALAAASAPVSIALAFALDLTAAYPFVLGVTLAIVMICGIPAMALVQDRPTWSRALIAGLLTGAIVPAALVPLSALGDLPWDAALLSSYMQMVGGFGLLGAIGAALAFGLALWMMSGSRIARAAAFGMMATGIAAIWLMPAGAMDLSCHNSLRDGRRSESPVATFTLDLTMDEWRAVQGELENFARSRSWDVRSDVRPDPGFPWFQVSLCREPGTSIFITKAAFEEDRMSIRVMQPQGGHSWRQPMDDLHRQLAQRWPEQVRPENPTP